MTATMPPNVKKTKVFSFVFFSFFRRLLTYYEASIEVMFFSPLLVISLSLCCTAESFSFECRTERDLEKKGRAQTCACMWNRAPGTFVFAGLLYERKSTIERNKSELPPWGYTRRRRRRLGGKKSKKTIELGRPLVWRPPARGSRLLFQKKKKKNGCRKKRKN